jgi:alpha/beta superfamily hydrolase
VNTASPTLKASDPCDEDQAGRNVADMTHDIDGPAGRLEAKLDHPTTASRAVAVIASPDPTQGGTMQDKVIYHATQGLLRVGCAVLRFNYRGTGTSEGAFSKALVAAIGASRGGPNGEAGNGTIAGALVDDEVVDAEGEGRDDVYREALEDYKAALDAAAKRYRGLPIWAIGYSFGAYVAMVSGATDARVKQLIGIGTVLDGYDFTSVKETDKPKILVHGERDMLCSMKAIRRFYGELLEPRELVVIDMADHYFDGHTSEVGDALEDLLIDEDNEEEE